jgi:hypothetical protein
MFYHYTLDSASFCSNISNLHRRGGINIGKIKLIPGNIMMTDGGGEV